MQIHGTSVLERTFYGSPLELRLSTGLAAFEAVGAGNCVTSRDLVIFADQATLWGSIIRSEMTWTVFEVEIIPE